MRRDVGSLQELRERLSANSQCWGWNGDLKSYKNKELNLSSVSLQMLLGSCISN